MSESPAVRATLGISHILRMMFRHVVFLSPADLRLPPYRTLQGWQMSVQNQLFVTFASHLPWTTVWIANPFCDPHMRVLVYGVQGISWSAPVAVAWLVA